MEPSLGQRFTTKLTNLVSSALNIGASYFSSTFSYRVSALNLQTQTIIRRLNGFDSIKLKMLNSERIKLQHYTVTLRDMMTTSKDRKVFHAQHFYSQWSKMITQCIRFSQSLQIKYEKDLNMEYLRNAQLQHDDELSLFSTLPRNNRRVANMTNEERFKCDGCPVTDENQELKLLSCCANNSMNPVIKKICNSCFYKNLLVQISKSLSRGMLKCPFCNFNMIVDQGGEIMIKNIRQKLVKMMVNRFDWIQQKNQQIQGELTSSIDIKQKEILQLQHQVKMKSMILIDYKQQKQKILNNVSNLKNSFIGLMESMEIQIKNQKKKRQERIAQIQNVINRNTDLRVQDLINNSIEVLNSRKNSTIQVLTEREEQKMGLNVIMDSHVGKGSKNEVLAEKVEKNKKNVEANISNSGVRGVSQVLTEREDEDKQNVFNQ